MNFRVSSLALLTIPALCLPQTPPKVSPTASPDEMGEMVFSTSIGSFKLVSPGERNAQGKLVMNFRGTLLVVGYKPNTPNAQVQVEGNLRKEYENSSRERVLFHGQGRVVLDGKFKSVQWFGRDLQGKFNGLGIFRLYGEFDSKGQTGSYTITGDKTRYWATGGMVVVVPKPDLAKVAKPRVKID